MQGAEKGLIVRKFYLHFCKKLFQPLEPMTFWWHDKNFTSYVKVPLSIITILTNTIWHILFLKTNEIRRTLRKDLHETWGDKISIKAFSEDGETDKTKFWTDPVELADGVSLYLMYRIDILIFSLTLLNELSFIISRK